MSAKYDVRFINDNFQFWIHLKALTARYFSDFL